MTQRPAIRRLDLRLRAEFPHLATEIHELGPYQHVIFAPRELLDAADFGPVFAKQYRAIGDQVEFSNERPPSSKLIEPLLDHQIGLELEGLVFSWADLLTILAGKFPDLPAITQILDERGSVLRLSFETEISEHLRKSVQTFLKAILRRRTFVIDVAPAPTDPTTSDPHSTFRHIEFTDTISFKPINRRPQVPPFVAREEEWWFSNLGNLFTGQVTPQSFSFTRDAGMACYLHSTAFPQIDLRQLLFAYDTIYLEPPLNDGPPGKFPSFWESQTLGRDDLLKLVAADRVRILHSQPEERSDLGFLREAHETNPNGVIGRRQSAAMMIADVVETANEYLLAQPSLAGQMKELIARLASDTGAPINEIARLLLYPLQARRECLQPLMYRGLMAYASLGQGEAFAQAFERVRGKDVRLEAGTFGCSIHNAHMLKATFVPQAPHEGYVSSWLGPMQHMGDRLNFYSALNTRVAAAWAVNERRKEERRIVLPPIPLLEFDRNVRLDDLLNLTAKTSDRRKGRALITRLADLPVEEREAEVIRLNTEWSRAMRSTNKRQHAALLIDSGFSVGTYALGVNVFPFVPAFTLIQMALNCARRAPTLDAIIDEIERAFMEKLGQNEDIPFLSKVSRVAHSLALPR